MVLPIYKKILNTSHILVLEFKCVQSCSHNFLLKSSYCNGHEKNIINNLNFIKKPDSCKSIDWFPDELTTSCNAILMRKSFQSLSITLPNIKR